MRALLAVCTIEGSDDSDPGPRPRFSGDISAPLLTICAQAEGVLQALALQALKAWTDADLARIHACVQHGAAGVLLRALHAALPAAAADPSAAYTASMAVVLLRRVVRDGGEAGEEAFLDADGVRVLLALSAAPSLCDRSLCLALYLLNDVTRRSAGALEAAVGAGAVPLIVGLLR